MYFSSHLMYHMYLCLDWFHLQKKTEFKARWSVVSCKAYRTSRGISLEKQYCKHPSQSLKLWVSCWLPSYSHESNSYQRVFLMPGLFQGGSSMIVIVHKVHNMICFQKASCCWIHFLWNEFLRISSSWGAFDSWICCILPYSSSIWRCKIGDPDWLSIWERRSMLRKLQPLHCRIFLSSRKEVKSIEINWIPCVSVFRWGNPAAKGGFAHADPLKWGFAFWLPGHFRDLQMMSDDVRWCQSFVHDVFCRCATPEVWPRRRIPGRHEATSRTWERRELEILNAPQKSAKPIETEADAAVGVPNMCGERCCLR